MSAAAGALGGLYIVAVIFLIYLAAVWIFLPFAIFGTKRILRDMLAEQKRANDLLQALAGNRTTPPALSPRATSELAPMGDNPWPKT